MYDPEEQDDDAKLRDLRADFQAAIDAREDAVDEAHRAGRFYHNTQNEGQWEESDRQYLVSQKRVVMSFNLIRPKIDTFVGTVTERKRQPTARGVGGEDKLAADVLNFISDRVDELTDCDQLDADVLKQGTIHGEHCGQLIVEEDPENPLQVRFKRNAIPHYEISWDPASRLPDRTDARFFFWDKWLSKTEFTRMYPDAEWDDVYRKGDGDDDSLSNRSSDRGESALFDDFNSDSDMYDGVDWRYYRDEAQHQKVRVMHAEYRVPMKKYFLIDRQGSVAEEVSKSIHDKYEMLAEAGALAGGLERKVTTSEHIHTVQFVSHEILKDEPLGQPYDGFSVVPFTFAIDSETKESYGAVRNLFDPQTETNKAHSLALELQAGQNKTGTIAEKGAIDDVPAYQQQGQTTGGVQIVKDGALTENKVRDRTPPQFSSAVTQRLNDSVTMIDKISNVPTDDTSPAGQAEAYGTVQLRHRRSQISMADVVGNYDRYMRGMKLRQMQAIVRGMPDAQVIEYLGNEEKYQIQQAQNPQTGEMESVIYEVDKATGQPEKQAKFDDFRTMKFDVRLEVTSRNVTEMMLQSQGLAHLKQIGVAVDDEVLVESAVVDRSTRERLREFAKSSAESAAQQQQMQQEAQQMQLAQMLSVEQAKTAETQRHNQASEELDYLKITGDHQTKVADVLQKADASEKRAVLEIVKAIETRQAQRAIAPTSGGTPYGR